ncbi:class I SAM-dependent methyltransferase [Nonomuraea sp. NPDC049649]|uniref:SAM-dependent methyltransferase n=1 Tax=Nonomuraea sp. NPDC049649 TaxID=3155776 RepID=UPI003433564D
MKHVIGVVRSLWHEPRPPDPPRRVWRDWALVGVLVPVAVLEGVRGADLPSVLLTLGLIPTLLWRRTRPLLMLVIAFGATSLATRSERSAWMSRMDRQQISHLAHRDHPIAAPVSGAHVTRLLRRARLPEGARILDLGCGEAAWTLRALALYEDATADGVDISAEALRAAEEHADRQGLWERIRLHEKPAADFPVAETYDLVLCVGATHAFGGLRATAEHVRRYLKPNGLALIGEGFWEREPTPDALTRLGASPSDFFDLPGTVALAESCGFDTVYAYTSDLSEWDDYEWSWTGTLLRWANEHPGPDADTVRAAAREHRDMWLHGYRGVLGFVTLLLQRQGSSQ